MSLKPLEQREPVVSHRPRRPINASVNELLLSTQIPIGRRRKKTKKKPHVQQEPTESDGDGDDETYRQKPQKMASVTTSIPTPNIRGSTHLTTSGSHVTILEREDPYAMGTGLTLGRLSIAPPQLTMLYSSPVTDSDGQDEGYDPLFGQTYNHSSVLTERLTRVPDTPFYNSSPPDELFGSSVSSASSVDFNPLDTVSTLGDNASTPPDDMSMNGMTPILPPITNTTVRSATGRATLPKIPKRRTSLLVHKSSTRHLTCVNPITVSDHPLSEFGDDSDDSDDASQGFTRAESFTASFTEDDDDKEDSLATINNEQNVADTTTDTETKSSSTRSKLVSNITKSFKAFSNAASKFSTSHQAQASSNSALFAFSPRSTDECMVMTDGSHEEPTESLVDAAPKVIPLKTYNYSSTLLPVVRPREHRMNPDFLRIYASEALMRQRGKLDPSFVGRATMLLPPRTDNPDSYYRLKAGIDGEWERVFGIRKRFVTKFDAMRSIISQKQVPERWIPLSWDDFEDSSDEDVDTETLATQET